MMQIFHNSSLANPRVSIVLLDWSIRESFHILDYLREQTVPRAVYEIIWVEYYSTRPAELEKRHKESEIDGKTPLDTWAILGMSKGICYHKHLMYNTGILLARGDIVVFCDSDAMVKPTFVASIIKSFEENSDIVLHLDEVRNIDRSLYPFDYPPFGRVEGIGCVNLTDGKPSGLQSDRDKMHARNYGACMCAKRDDLLAIGGADQHIDYLGHICGPYEMTFRLKNYGKKELWHEEEWLYHTWHPGQGGLGNYLGPHDGKFFSTTALAIPLTGRIQPLTRNPGIQSKSCVVPDDKILREWRYTTLRLRTNALIPKRFVLFSLLLAVNLTALADYLLQLGRVDRVFRKYHGTRNPKQAIISRTARVMTGISTRKGSEANRKNTPFFMAVVFLAFFRTIQLWKESISRTRTLYFDNCIAFVYNHLFLEDIQEFAVIGVTPASSMLCRIAVSHCRLAGVFDDDKVGRLWMGCHVRKIDELRDYRGKIVMPLQAKTTEAIYRRLQSLNIPTKNILLF